MPIVPAGKKIVVGGTLYRAGDEYPEPKTTKKPYSKSSTDKEASHGRRTSPEHPDSGSDS